MSRLGFSFGALFLAQLAHSHHSSVGIYDEDRLIDIEGIVTSVRWRNPHPSYTIAVADESGATVEWHIETGSVSTLRLRGVDRDFIQIGDRVRLAGLSSLRGRPEMFAQNMLLDDGREVLLRAVSEPYWPAGLRGDLYRREFDETRAVEGRRTANEIFRVWTPVVDDPEAYPLYGAGSYPLTDSARELMARWDPRTSPFIGCRPKAMPYIMGSAYPLEFIRQGNDLLIRIEEFDTERLIHMNGPRSSTLKSYSLLGYSTGRWEGDTLVVETERIEASLLYGDGTPQSRSIRLVEHFVMNESEDRLDYRLVVTDPETFTETLEFTRFWVWQPDIRVEPYNCEE
jgi:hypothetical protein